MTPLPSIDLAKAQAKAVIGTIAIVVLLVLALVLGARLWWISHQASKVPELKQAAVSAQANAASANAGAENASNTRAAMDTATVDLRITTDASARRIEHASPAPTSGLPADAGVDVMRELDAAAAAYGAASDRLQRTSTGRAGAKRR